jgi:hypothetical protein
MSAAATAAGYLYASGRLRGRKEGEETTDTRGENRGDKRESGQVPVKRRQVRIAAIDRQDAPQSQENLSQAQDYPAKPAVRTKPAVRIQYRVRRWRPDEAA